MVVSPDTQLLKVSVFRQTILVFDGDASNLLFMKFQRELGGRG